ncbi:MAG: AMP-dependent synthetase/ligase [Aminipila sp.]
MLEAQKFVEQINNNKDVNIRYKHSRPINDLKQMLISTTELYPDNIAFLQKNDRAKGYEGITYKEALADVNALGTALIEKGLKNKRIAVIGENSYHWAISYLATVGGVGVIVPLDKELNANELMQLVVNSEVSCVLFDDKYEKIFRDMKISGETVIKLLINMQNAECSKEVMYIGQLLEHGRQSIINGARDYIDATIDREAMNILLFTSGTTGVSKGVMLCHRNIVEDLMATPTVLEIRSDDIFFSVLPVHHTYECTAGFLLPIYKGATIAYCEGLKYLTKNLEEVRPTIFLGVPILFENLYRKIWQNVRKQGKEELLKKVIKINRATKKVGLDLGNIFLKDIRAVFGGRMRLMICGGAAINPDILDGIRDFGIMALQGYGLTECAPIGALNPDKAAKSASIGRALPNFDMKVVDVNDEGIGEICLKGGNVMMGYYNMPEATAEVIKDGWFYTGDLGYIDSEGYAYITGRKKNVIITKNGKNVYPEEIEYYLSSIPYVLESFVYDKESEDGLDTLIVAAIRIDEEEVKECLGETYTDEQVHELIWNEVDKINDNTPYFKKVKRVVIRKEEFEKNTSKKIKRFSENNKA